MEVASPDMKRTVQIIEIVLSKVPVCLQILMDDQAQRLLVKDEFDERRGSDKKGLANRGTSS